MSSPSICLYVPDTVQALWTEPRGLSSIASGLDYEPWGWWEVSYTAALSL